MQQALERRSAESKARVAGAALRPLAIVGPTASGKSALAVALAERLRGCVINADALQVYRELRILTARPSLADEARVPHRLFGVLAGAEACSVGRWLALAQNEIAAARAAGRRPILVGGTGLYLKALEQGLAPVPAIPSALRRESEALLERLGPPAFRAALVQDDPASAAVLPNDRQRLLRAWQVLRATGRPLAEWQRETGPGMALDWLVLLPPRTVLRAAVARRFDGMLAAGALDEVRGLLALGLDPALPIMKAVGVRELAAVLRGERDLASASAAAIAASRQYVKRQTTWLRGQVLAKWSPTVIEEQFSESMMDRIFPILREKGLTG